MGEDVLLVPPRQVEQSARRQEVEAGLRQLRPALAGEPLVQLLLQAMEVAHVAGGIIAVMAYAQWDAGPLLER